MSLGTSGKTTLIVLATALAGGLGMAPAGASGGVSDSSGMSSSQLMTAVAQSTPVDLAGDEVSAVPSTSGFSSPDGGITIPGNASGVVSGTYTLESGQQISIGLGLAGSATVPGELMQDGSVVYNQVGNYDQTVRITEDGVRIHLVIHRSDGPIGRFYEVQMPAGARMVLASAAPVEVTDPGDNSGSVDDGVVILDASNNFLGGFAAPWARDANGKIIQTKFSFINGKLYQSFNHVSETTKYPVVVDPYLGLAMIKSASWVQHPEGWTLQVTPTGWSRANAGSYTAGHYGWRELYGKYRNRGLNTNLDGMRDQYICHQQIVAIRSPRKATWNLDEWRPNYSYAGTVNASCNPGGAKWFD